MSPTTDTSEWVIPQAQLLVTNLNKSLQRMRRELAVFHRCLDELTKEFVSFKVPACDIELRLAEYDLFTDHIFNYESKIAILEQALPDLLMEVKRLTDGGDVEAWYEAFEME